MVTAPDPSSGLQPWDQRPGESRDAWSAFRLHKDAGPRRRLRLTAADYYNVEEGARGWVTKMRQVEQWSSRWDWTERCKAWDQHLARVADDEVEALAAQQAGQHLRLADKMVEKAMERLEQLDPLTDLSNRDMIDLLKVGTGLARQAAGEPTVITRQEVKVSGAEEDSIAAAIARNPEVAILAGELAALLGEPSPEPEP